MIILGLLAIAIAIAYWHSYPRFGHWLYHSGNNLEAKLYGFKRAIVSIEGIDHVYWHNGKSNKPALLLIHGFSASHAVWLRFARYFNNDYFVIIPDLAGHGETGFEQQWDYSIESQAQRMAALLHCLGCSSAHIVGNSMGGFIAAHMGRYYSNMCNSITLIDPAGVSSPEPSKMLQMLQSGRNPFVMNSDKEFYEFYNMVMARPPFAPKVVTDALSQTYQARSQELAKIFNDYNRQHNYLEAELSEIGCPALVIWGAQDQLIHVSSANVWQQGLQCTVHIWYDLGHMPMMEAPERTAFAVKNHIFTTQRS
ncbi:alpha/beta fold hydrolase [Alteromonas sp. ASW11-36]|uniref:Alpha/beta fold hydrolase n=1 Tax=Alteromonas arenosi TaxID=3055817 RepID=A0ABT7SXC8_9ALTE|nr:alpha/beta fold hydrolase [Alteromonas sp. ASW11-36]MDM7860842.1 alpha/beta fold hydrolase [Alteromonas sp. ASW11-36]